jgi:hypothetical protein
MFLWSPKWSPCKAVSSAGFSHVQETKGAVYMGKPRAGPVYGKSTFVITFYSILFCIYMGIKLARLSEVPPRLTHARLRVVGLGISHINAITQAGWIRGMSVIVTSTCILL